MKTIEERYNEKKITLAEALAIIRSNDEIVFGFCGNEPMGILSQLHTITQRGVKDVTVWTALMLGSYEFQKNPEFNQAFICNSWFFSAPTRAVQAQKLVSHSPVNLHDGFLRKLDIKIPRIFIGTVNPIDKHGYSKTSLSANYEKGFIEKCELVIMEVNPNMPKVWGDTELFIDDIDYFVEINRPIPILPDAPTTDEEKKIGKYVASLVNDGDTIQLGIGGIPNACAESLMSKKDLGVHTEMITSGMAKLAKAGVINGSKKTLHRGKMVGTFALGNQELYDFMDDNPGVILMRGEYVNNPSVICQNDNMVSINTALQVDLTGQVASESIGTKQWSGTGGQTDTATGAIHAKNGRSIIALTSTAKNGTISAISAVLPLGAIVTLSRNVVDYVVTEYGIAELKGAPIRQRVERLIAIAHPDFRDQLRADAEQYQIW